MRISNIQNYEFTGKLKRGDLIKKLNQLNEAAKVKATNLAAKSDVTAEETIYKIFDNPDKLTPKDYAKISTTASSTGTGIASSIGLTTTNNSGTWSIYSTLS